MKKIYLYSENRSLTYLVHSLILLFTGIYLLSAPGSHASISNRTLPTKFLAPPFQEENIVGINQDKDGFIWLATSNAIYRYNGYEYKVYGRDNPKLKKALQEINSLFIDSNNYLWISTSSAILYYDITNKSSKVFPQKLAHGSHGFQQDATGRIWFIHHDQIFYFNEEGNSIIQVDIKSKDLPSSINNLVLLANNKLLLSLGDNTCSIFDIDKSDYTPILPKQLATLCKGSKYLAMHREHLYVQQQDMKVSSYHLRTGELTDYITLNNGEYLNAVLVDKDNNIWFAGNNFLYRIINNTVQNLSIQNQDINRDGVKQLFEDSNGHLWILPHRQSSLSIFAPKFEYFSSNDEHYLHDIEYIGKKIRTLRIDSKGFLWILVDNDLHKISTQSFNVENIQLPPPTINPKIPRQIKDLVPLEDGSLIIADNTGLYVYTNELGELKQSAHLSKQFIDIRIDALAKDEENHIWIASPSHGTLSYNLITRQWQNHTSRARKEIEANNEIFIDSSKTIWLASDLGIRRIHISFQSSEPQQQYLVSELVPNTLLCGGKVSQFFESHTGEIWIASDSGLTRYRKSDGSFSCFTKHHGLPSNNIKSISEDSASNTMWIATDEGISQISRKGEIIHNFTPLDGLLGNISRKTGLVDGNDYMWIGTDNGLHRFRPSKVSQSSTIQNIAITGIFINGEELQHSEDINQLKQLELTHKQKNLEIRFAQLDYGTREKHRYQVQIKSWQEIAHECRPAGWEDTGEKNSVYYSNLVPGEYKIKISLGPTMDNATLTHKTLIVKIAPPFWQERKILAKSLFIILPLIILFFFYRFFFVASRKQETKQNSPNTTVLFSQDNEHEQENTSFFTPVRELDEDQALFLQSFKEYVEQHYSDPNLTAQTIAEHFNINDKKLRKLLQSLLDNSASKIIREYRLDKSLSILQQGELVTDVAFSVGFSDPNYFSKCFKQKFQRSPGSIKE